MWQPCELLYSCYLLTCLRPPTATLFITIDNTPRDSQLDLPIIPKLVFRSLAGRCDRNQFLVLCTLLHRLCIYVVLSTALIRWTQAASGAAGRANVSRGLSVCLSIVTERSNRNTKRISSSNYERCGDDVSVVSFGMFSYAQFTYRTFLPVKNTSSH